MPRAHELLRRPFRGWSLRTRLTATLVGLAAVGLVALAAITYGSQKDFLEQRVDEQAESAIPFIARQIVAEEGYAERGLAPQSGPGAPGTGAGAGGPRLPPGARDLPAGSYVQLRSAAGVVVASRYVVELSADASTDLPAPKLPAKLPGQRQFSVDAVGGGGSYRVHVQRDPQTGTIALLAVPAGAISDQLARLLVVEGIVILGVLLALGLVAARLVGTELAPLRRIASDADAIAAGELDRRVAADAHPETEVGRLGVALNAMLERIELGFEERKAVEERLRRFLSDASHELRTPLASIRGYAELQRSGMLDGDEDRLLAAARIEEQATRMGVLVEDLLALARLEEQQRPPDQLIDLASVATGAVADARALDGSREWTLAIDGDPLVLGQESQLHQVFTNLLGNAVAHTPAGSPVAVTVRVDGEAVVVEVDDAGEGVPASERDAIFERFHRSGGESRTRGPAGAGLGLAVVRGIAEAHGGSAGVGQSPAGGARFSVRLPLAPTGD